MARNQYPYDQGVALAQSGMSYRAWRDLLLENNADVGRTLQRARSSGDLQFYNVTLPDGSVETRIALRGEAIPAQEA